MTDHSQLGAYNSGADDYALFLKKWSGEILTTFEETNVMKSLHTVRSISSGKSAQFPVIGTASTKYHSPGESVIETTGYLNQIKHGERLIWVDKLLTSSVFIARVDELINHYDVRSIYSTELGRAMAKKFDEQLLLLSVIGAYTEADDQTSGNQKAEFVPYGGSIVQTPGPGNSAASDILKGIRVAMQTMDEKDIPAEDRAIIVSPETFYKIIEQRDMIDRDVSPDNGSMAGGTVFSAWGGQIVVSNHIPASIDHTDTTNRHEGAAAGEGNQYVIDLTDEGTNDISEVGLGTGANIKAVVLQKSGLGTVKLLDMSMESEYQVERQGSLFVSKYAMGHGMLRPESCAVVQTASAEHSILAT